MDVLSRANELESHQEDLFDWHGCEAVQFDPEKLGGRATVGDSRMDADGILLNFLDGMTAEEISHAFHTDLEAIRIILKFAEIRFSRASA